jgi:hypothetical protein
MACSIFKTSTFARDNSPLASPTPPQVFPSTPAVCPFPIDLYRPCSESLHFVEHLACERSASSLRADRLPLDLSSRHRTHPTPLDTLAQTHLFYLSLSCCSPSPRSAARQRPPRRDSAPAAPR